MESERVTYLLYVCTVLLCMNVCMHVHCTCMYVCLCVGVCVCVCEPVAVFWWIEMRDLAQVIEESWFQTQVIIHKMPYMPAPFARVCN